jgi:hypothetical protein
MTRDEEACLHRLLGAAVELQAFLATEYKLAPKSTRLFISVLQVNGIRPFINHIERTISRHERETSKGRAA